MPMDGKTDIGMQKRTPEKTGENAKVELRDYAMGDEDRIVQILSACHAQGWQDEDHWRWKHLNRPGFSQQQVVIACVDGKMAGCFHGAILPLRLEAGLEVPMCFDGDFAVLAEYRGREIPIQAHDLTDRRLLQRGALLRGGFASRELNERFYHKNFGHIFVPMVISRFKKIIGIRPLQRKVEALGTKFLRRSWLHRALKRQPWVVDLQIENFPPCHIEFTERSFSLREGASQQHDFWIQIPYGLLVALNKGLGPSVKSALLNFIGGRLRIRGLLRKGPDLLALLWWGLTKR